MHGIIGHSLYMLADELQWLNGEIPGQLVIPPSLNKFSIISFGVLYLQKLLSQALYLELIH